VTEARHPFRVTATRRLELAVDERHIADMVRLVVLTGAGERLHRPDFGAGLGTALFEPLDLALSGVIEMRLRGSLDQALGDRIEVTAVDVDVAPDQALIAATLTYRLRSSGTVQQLEVRTSV
jgi:phage baseplate assembly protein W